MLPRKGTLMVTLVSRSFSRPPITMVCPLRSITWVSASRVEMMGYSVRARCSPPPSTTPDLLPSSSRTEGLTIMLMKLSSLIWGSTLSWMPMSS